MTNHDEHTHDDDIRIDVLCSCGEPDVQMKWEDFLRVVDDAEVVPERRSPVVLRVSFKGQQGTTAGAKIDARIRRVFQQLVVRGAVQRVGDHYEAPGLVLRTGVVNEH